MPQSLIFGNCPYPDVIQSHLPASNPMVKESGAPAVPVAVVWHRMIGTLRGTDGWFHAGHAATCYGVGCAATDAPSDAGRIFEWIEPRTGWYGESSGPVNDPYGDGLKLVNEVGVLSVNRTTKAIEISGEYDTPLDDKCRAAIVNMTAYWADQKRIPWDQFPIVPGTDGRSFVIHHQEITIGSGKICPGPVVMGETPALIKQVAAVLKQYQTGDATMPPETPVPGPIWWTKGDTGPVKRASDGAVALAMLGQITAKRDCKLRVSASGKAAVVGTMKQGQTGTLVGTYAAPQKWYFAEVPGIAGTVRVPATHFVERFPTI